MTAQRFIGGPRHNEVASPEEQGQDELWVIEQEITPAGEVVRQTRHHYVADAFGRYVYKGVIS